MGKGTMVGQRTHRVTNGVGHHVQIRQRPRNPSPEHGPISYLPTEYCFTNGSTKNNLG
jgi:hypothetical protein